MQHAMRIWRAGFPLRGWAFRLALAVLFALSLTLLWYIGTRLGPPIRSGNKAFSDFFAHWSYGGFAVAHPGPAIYDPDAMAAFQRGLFDGRLKSLPFVYPPPYLFLVAPLALFDVWHGALAWSLASVAAFAVALNAGRWRPSPVLVSLLAPSTVLCLGYGQNGLVLAALLAGGLRLLPTRPGWGGAVLALACIKPQMAVLLPVALLAGRQWRAIGGALATGVALAAASIAWIGPQAWIDWAGVLRHQADFAAQWIGAHHQATLVATLSQAGIARPLGLVVQAVAAAIVALGVAAAWRRGPTPEAAATLLSGVLLVVPYGFVYDLPIITAAALTLVSGRRALSWPEAAVIAAALLLPMVLFLTSRFFWTGPVVQAALFALCLARALAAPAPQPRLIRADGSGATPP